MAALRSKCFGVGLWTVERVQGPVYLRGNVIRSSTEGACSVALIHALPAHPKVSYLYVALTVKQYIIQLQIPEKEGNKSQRYESF